MYRAFIYTSCYHGEDGMSLWLYRYWFIRKWRIMKVTDLVLVLKEVTYCECHESSDIMDYVHLCVVRVWAVCDSGMDGYIVVQTVLIMLVWWYVLLRSWYRWWGHIRVYCSGCVTRMTTNFCFHSVPVILTNHDTISGTHKQTNKLRGLSPRANYTDRAAAAGRRS